MKREVQKEGIEMKEPVTLEEEYEKIKEVSRLGHKLQTSNTIHQSLYTII